MKRVRFGTGPRAGVLMGVAVMLMNLNAPVQAELSFGSGITVYGVETKSGALVYDLGWTASREQWKTSRAWAVVPADSPSGPGILYFHELGKQRNRSQFLDEALSLTASGVRSVLIDGNAPWSESWKGTAEDALMLDAQMADLETALGILRRLPGVDAANLGYVGHDYGAMYGSILYTRDTPLKAFALIAPAPRFADWISYFSAAAAADKPAYSRLLGQRDPLDNLARPGKADLLLQFYEFDTFIPKARADELIAAVPAATAQFIKGTSHDGIAAKGRGQRLAWLLPRLGGAVR